MAGGEAVGEYQLLFCEIDIADIVPVDDKALANADEIGSAEGELLCQQPFDLAELHCYDSRLAVGEHKRGIVAVGRYEYNLIRCSPNQVDACRYDQIFFHKSIIKRGVLFFIAKEVHIFHVEGSTSKCNAVVQRWQRFLFRGGKV